jgi:hypothetical protein
MAAESRTVGTVVLAELADGQKYLQVSIDIDCPICGQYTAVFMGHHLRAIRQILSDAIDEHPDQTLRETDVRTLETLKFSGPSNDPETS